MYTENNYYTMIRKCCPYFTQLEEVRLSQVRRHCVFTFYAMGACWSLDLNLLLTD